MIINQSKELFQKKIDFIMDNFDFRKVFDVMTFLNWTWINTPIEFESDLRTVVREKLKGLYPHLGYILSEFILSTGGFKYLIIKDEEYEGNYNIRIEFILESLETE